jgi:hypothetical protein
MLHIQKKMTNYNKYVVLVSFYYLNLRMILIYSKPCINKINIYKHTGSLVKKENVDVKCPIALSLLEFYSQKLC